MNSFYFGTNPEIEKNVNEASTKCMEHLKKKNFLSFFPKVRHLLRLDEIELLTML